MLLEIGYMETEKCCDGWPRCIGTWPPWWPHKVGTIASVKRGRTGKMAKDNPLILTGTFKGQKVKLCLRSASVEGLTRKCPKCRQVKPLEDFGLRQMPENELREQSWCLDCR